MGHCGIAAGEESQKCIQHEVSPRPGHHPKFVCHPRNALERRIARTMTLHLTVVGGESEPHEKQTVPEAQPASREQPNTTLQRQPLRNSRGGLRGGSSKFLPEPS